MKCWRLKKSSQTPIKFTTEVLQSSSNARESPGERSDKLRNIVLNGNATIAELIGHTGVLPVYANER